MVLLLRSITYRYSKLVIRPLLKQNFHKNNFVMANSKFEYVRAFEIEDKLGPAQWIAINLKFIDSEVFEHAEEYVRNNDPHVRVQNAMTEAVKKIIVHIQDLKLCYVYGNKCVFILSKHSNFFKRRGFKLLTSITSSFSSAFVSSWNFPSTTPSAISLLPIFEGCIYLFPQDQLLRDYLTFCQHDCHLSNLYITTLRNLINIGQLDFRFALEKVNNSTEGEKNEMLFSICNINYNNENEESKKGVIFFYESLNVRKDHSHISPIKKFKHQARNSRNLVDTCDDFCKNHFWNTNIKLEEVTSHRCKFDMLSFKKSNHIILHSWIVIRLDGISFHKFSEKHNFKKPNDLRSLNLMNGCAKIVMTKFPSIILGYGQSDEYSFVMKRYNHGEKEGYSLISQIVSLFSGAFVHLWCTQFSDTPLVYHPSFDARFVLYPTNSSLRDYLSWRQADCHINNMYNTCFWNIIAANKKKIGQNIEDINFQTQEILKGTYSKDKLKILKGLNIIYNQEEPIYRKGTVIYTSEQSELLSDDGNSKCLIEDHCDIINDEFWNRRKWLLAEELKPMNSTEEHLMDDLL